MAWRTLYALAVVLGVIAGGHSARAAVDINGPWFIQFSPGLGPTSSCIADVTHAGTSIEIAWRSGGCAGGTGSYIGTIDRAAGTFTATRTGAPHCSTETLRGTVTSGSRSFRGTWTCENPFFPFSGNFDADKCRNGVIDGGEACDHGLANQESCCTDSCTLRRAGIQCGDDGDLNPCTARVCDGRSGLCPAATAPRPAGFICAVDQATCAATACDGAGNCTIPGTKPDGWSCHSPCYENGSGVCRSGVCNARRLPAGSTCVWDIDGNGCTVDRCDAGGTCVAGPCSACCDDSGGTCQPSYEATCRSPAVSIMSKLALGRTRGTLVWLWAHGDDSDFNDPAVNGATLCLYSGPSKQLLALAEAPSGTCGSRPCWSRTSSGRWRYRGYGRNGLYALDLQEYGSTTAKILARGRRMSFRDWSMSGHSPGMISLPVHAQLKVGGRCWESTFPVADRTEETFVAPPRPR